jgi:WD40-like Beta Propeller Repeat
MSVLADRSTGSRWPRGLRRAPMLLAALPLLLAACNSSPSPQPTVTITAPVSPAGVTSPASSASPTAPPGVVAVTSAGNLVVLGPTGNIASTLVTGGVLGDEISVSPNGQTVYFAVRQAACDMTIESISINGGTATPIAAGELPAVSPDGTQLAYAQEPFGTADCTPSASKYASSFKLVIRNLSTGSQRIVPQPPEVVKSGLPQPISHLSWSANGQQLAVSISAVQDNEGWSLNLISPSSSQYYLPPGAGVTNVPLTGGPYRERSYIREGVFLPDGNLFISRACCGGFPPRNLSRLMWEVTPAGALVHQVAIGYPNLDHVSLDASANGQWLLYLAGGTLYVSQDGNRPNQMATGLIAAAWI